jgi:hypothetical protein
LLKSFASTALEASDGLAPEEHRRIYKMLNLKTTALLDGGVSYWVPDREAGQQVVEETIR